MDFDDPNDPVRALQEKDDYYRVLYAVVIASWTTVFAEMAIRRGEFPLWLGPMILLDIWCVSIATESLRAFWSATAGTPTLLTRRIVDRGPAPQPATS